MLESFQVNIKVVSKKSFSKRNKLKKAKEMLVGNNAENFKAITHK